MIDDYGNTVAVAGVPPIDIAAAVANLRLRDEQSIMVQVGALRELVALAEQAQRPPAAEQERDRAAVLLGDEIIKGAREVQRAQAAEQRAEKAEAALRAIAAVLITSDDPTVRVAAVQWALVEHGFAGMLYDAALRGKQAQ